MGGLRQSERMKRSLNLGRLRQWLSFGGEKVYTAPGKAVAMIPLPPRNSGDANYGDGDEEVKESLYGHGDSGRATGDSETDPLPYTPNWRK